MVERNGYRGKDERNGHCAVRIQFHEEAFAMESVKKLEGIAKQYGCVVQQPHINPVDKRVVLAQFLNRLVAGAYYRGALEEYSERIQSGEIR